MPELNLDYEVHGTLGDFYKVHGTLGDLFQRCMFLQSWNLAGCGAIGGGVR